MNKETRNGLISLIERKYSLKVPKMADDIVISSIMSKKLHRVEVMNLLNGRKLDEFEETELQKLSTSDLYSLARKHAKRPVPVGLKSTTYIDLLMERFDPAKLTEKELQKLGESTQSTTARAAKMYGGWLPKVGGYLNQKSIDRGKKFVRK